MICFQFLKLANSWVDDVISREFWLFTLESDLITIGFSMVLSLGGILALTSGFDDDDDQDGGGTGSPVFDFAYSPSPS